MRNSRKKLAELEPAKTEFFRVDIGNGVTSMAGACFHRTSIPHAKYPLLVHVYGEPAGQTVLDRWGGGNQLWHRMLARAGLRRDELRQSRHARAQGPGVAEGGLPQDRNPGARRIRPPR